MALMDYFDKAVDVFLTRENSKQDFEVKRMEHEAAQAQILRDQNAQAEALNVRAMVEAMQQQAATVPPAVWLGLAGLAGLLLLKR